MCDLTDYGTVTAVISKCGRKAKRYGSQLVAVPYTLSWCYKGKLGGGGGGIYLTALFDNEGH